MNDFLKTNYYWELFQINDINFYQIINSLIKIKFNLLLVLQNKYANIGWCKKIYSNWIKLFPEYEIIWVREDTLNNEGIYSFFDVLLYDLKTDKHIIVTLLMEPQLLSYPIDTISYDNFKNKFNNLLFFYIACYVFNDQVIFEIINKYEFVTHDNDEVINIFEQNWIQSDSSLLIKESSFVLEEIEHIDALEPTLLNSNTIESIEHLLTKNKIKINQTSRISNLLVQKYFEDNEQHQNIKYFLKNFIWKQVKKEAN